MVQIGDIQPTKEFDFSSEKIDENFSNYSAFHHRSVYIQRLEKSSRDVVESEFSIIENAIYTEPDDQSSWWYHQFLLTWISQREQNSGEENPPTTNWRSWFQSILDQQIKVMEGLLEIEATSKWAMSSLSMMIELLLNLLCGEHSIDESEYNTQSTVHILNERRNNLLTNLCEIDPFHTNRYKFLRRRKYIRSSMPVNIL